MKNLYILLVLLLSITNQTIAANNGSTEVLLDVRKEALFEKIIKDEISKKSNPLTDEEVERIKKDINEWQRKQNSRLKEPEILNRSFPVSFKPKTKAEELYFSPNYTTTVIFLDKLGNPWPLTKYVIGNSSKFQIEELPPSTLIITPLEEYAYGNLTVMLEGKNVPAIFTIKTNNDKVDYKVEARVDSIGPNSGNVNKKITSVGGNSSIVVNAGTNPYSFFPEEDITNLLNGEPPEELLKNKKRVSGHDDIEVYEYNEKLYILTNGTVSTPAPLDGRQNANGRNLFITVAMPFIFVIENGELIKVQIRD